jgi:hypothetical protein
MYVHHEYTEANTNVLLNLKEVMTRSLLFREYNQPVIYIDVKCASSHLFNFFLLNLEITYNQKSLYDITMGRFHLSFWHIVYISTFIVLSDDHLQINISLQVPLAE